MQHLTGVGLVSSGFLRILAVYVLLAVLVRLTSRSRLRHAVWLLFLLGTGVYGVTLLTQVLKPGLFIAGASPSVVTGVSAAGGEATGVAIPSSWDHCLELASGGAAWIYVGGVILLLFRLARRRRSLRRAVATARPVNTGLERAFDVGSHHLGVSRCRILELPGLSSPSAAYTWSPVILFPEDIDSCLDSEQLIDVLYHELIHVRRLDFLWGTVGEFVSCLMFFHPAVWLALRNLGRERELACDGAVMELRRGRRTDYALSLVRLARRRVLGCQLDSSSHLALLNSFLAFRVQILLAENHRRSFARQLTAVAGAVVALFVFFAGWSSLSLDIGLAPPPVVSARLVLKSGHSAAFPSRIARRGNPHQRSIEITLRVANPDPPRGIPSAPELISSVPVSEDGTYDALIPASPAESEGSPPQHQEGAVWDETTPTNTSTPPSLRQAVLNAAIDALRRVVLGRGRDRDGDGDDRD